MKPLLLATSLMMLSCTGGDPQPVSTAPPNIDDQVDPEPEPEPEPEPAPEPEDDDAKCDAMEKEIDAKIDALPRVCEKDEDCVVTGFGCPFGCSEILSKADEASPAVKEIESMAEKYWAACSQCVYKCGEPPEAACEEGKCVATREG